MSAGQEARADFPVAVVLPFLAIGAVSFVPCLVDAHWGMFLLGMTISAILRIITYARFSLMAWPITEWVTDWAKVEALRREASP